MKSNDPRKPDAFVVINLGRYTVDEASRTITYKIERAGYSSRNGSERSLIATLHGDTAALVTAKIKDEFGTFAFCPRPDEAFAQRWGFAKRCVRRDRPANAQ